MSAAHVSGARRGEGGKRERPTPLLGVFPRPLMAGSTIPANAPHGLDRVTHTPGAPQQLRWYVGICRCGWETPLEPSQAAAKRAVYLHAGPWGNGPVRGPGELPEGF